MKKTKDFEFKQFKIYGGYSGMPVSTDGVLLGAWSDLDDAASLLDIGTGTGLLSLMCAQRSPRLKIEAIDIDDNAIAAAKINFMRSPWQPRLTLHKGDVLTHNFTTQFERIICNPPYFNHGEQAENASRASARHTNDLTHKALLTRCQALLCDQGRASFILPAFEGEQFIQLASAQNWSLSRLCQVKPSERKPITRLLIELTRQDCQTQQQQLTIYDNANYSDTFKALTKAFYLKM